MADNKAKADGFYKFAEPVRAFFLNATKPSTPKLANGALGKPTYNGTFGLLPGSRDLNGLREKMTFVAGAKWPGRALGEIEYPVITGEDKAAEAKKKNKDGSIFLGHIIFNAHTSPDYPPKLGVLENGQLIQLDTDVLRAQYANKFYHGCYVAPQVNLVAWDGNGKNIPDCVTAYLQMVLWIKDGTRIGGADMADVFKDYVGAVTPGVDPTGGYGAPRRSSEIPF